LEGTEFSEGVLTGRILWLHDMALLLYLASAGLAFVDRRFAGPVALLGCLLSLPLYLYEIAAGPFRALFPGEYSVPLSRSFVWDTRAIGSMALIVGLTVISVVVRRGEPRTGARDVRQR
jgi:hypothetical protein